MGGAHDTREQGDAGDSAATDISSTSRSMGLILCTRANAQRPLASQEWEDLELLGLDHPLVVSYLQYYRDLPPGDIGVRVKSHASRSGALSIWHVTTQGDRGETRIVILPLSIDNDGQRVPAWERHIDRLFQSPPSANCSAARHHLLIDTLEPMMHRELLHRCIISEHRGYDFTVIRWVRVV